MGRAVTLSAVVVLAIGVSGAVPALHGAAPQGASAQAGAAQGAAAQGSHKHYVAPAADQDRPSPSGELAPRLQRLGTHVFPVSTSSARAQLFINQGVNLAWAFNHAEAGRAFREAARLDPSLAMAYWGQALVLGPNINAVMEPADEPKAFELTKKAQSLAPKATAREQALMGALAERYSGRADDRAARDRAYAAAMRRVRDQFPNDLDVATLWAESAMNLRPWGYWMPDGRPHEGTAEIASTIERVIARAPSHPGALHLYIHLMEAHQPWKAEGAADRLLPLMPAAGHMVHMPAHIYQRVGRYADAIKSNQLAITADEDYITQCRAQGLYPLGYYPHNLHFLWWSATFDGQSRLALDAAAKTASKVDDAILKQMPMLAGFRVLPYYALTRFGRWSDMLAQPEPPRDNVYLWGVWTYARGLALAATGRLDEAERAVAAITALLPDRSLDVPLFSPNTGRALLTIAPDVLGGEIAAARKQYDAAIAHLERAVRLDDGLVYTEPAEWHYPPRHALGAVLLEAGRAAEAETVYWEDLRRNRENGWALFGLGQALRAQAKTDTAALVDARFKAAWSRADLTLTGSRFGR